MFYSGIADEAGKPIDTQIKAHKELGWDYVEVRAADDTSLSMASDEKFEELYEKLAASGLKVSCFASALANWATDISDPIDKDVKELTTAIPRMRRLGCPFIRVMSYANKKNNVPKTEWRDEAIRRVAQLAKIAEDGGVTLVHENCDGWAGLGPDETLEMLEKVNSPALKLVFDTGNPIGHNQDSYAYFKAVQEHVIYVHIKDAKMEDGKHTRTFPGEGQGAVREILSDLFAAGFDGGVSIEPHLAAVIHSGKTSDADVMYNTYVDTGAG